MCDRCSTVEGSLAHQFWFCPFLHDLWCNILNWFLQIFKTVIKLDCTWAILGCSDRVGVEFPFHQRQPLWQAWGPKKLTLLERKSPSPPCFKWWLNEMLLIIKMEQICLGAWTSETFLATMQYFFFSFSFSFNMVWSNCVELLCVDESSYCYCEMVIHTQ